MRRWTPASSSRRRGSASGLRDGTPYSLAPPVTPTMLALVTVRCNDLRLCGLFAMFTVPFSDGHRPDAAPANPCCRHASYTATAATLDRLSERDPGTIGTRTRAVTRGCRCTCSGRPVDSGPNISTSPGWYATEV